MNYTERPDYQRWTKIRPNGRPGYEALAAWKRYGPTEQAGYLGCIDAEYEAEHGQAPDDGQMAVMLYRLLFLSDTYPTLKTIVADLGPVPPVILPRRLQGQLLADKDYYFRDKVGPVVPVGCHAGDLFLLWTEGQYAQVRQALDEIAGAGYQFLRVWTLLNPKGTVPYWSPRSTGLPSVKLRMALEAFLDECIQRRLYVHLASGGFEDMDDTEIGDYLDMMVQVLKGPRKTHVALFELVNEGWATTPSSWAKDPARYAFWMQRFRDAVGIPISTALTHPYLGHVDNQDYAPWTPGYQKHVYYHPPRKFELWNQCRHAFSFCYEKYCRPLSWAGEPWGPGASGNKPHEPWINAASMVMLHLSYALAGATCFHSGAGVMYGRMGTFSEQPGFDLVPQAIATLPADLHQGKLVHGNPSQAERIIEVPDDDCRADHRILPDGRFVCLLHHKPGQKSYPVVRPFTGTVYVISDGAVLNTLGTGNGQINAGDLVLTEVAKGGEFGAWVVGQLT